MDIRKVVVTGGAGFIGSHIAEYFSRRGVTVTVLDSFRTGHRHNLAGLSVEVVEGSVTDARQVAAVVAGADYVFHLAAMVSVPESVEKPETCIDINVMGTLNVLQAARQHGVRKVVLSSSCAVYGDAAQVPTREAVVPAPISPYGITKLDGEYYLDMYRSQYGLPTASLRYFNVFGPRQDPRSQYAAAVPIFTERAVRNEDLIVYGDGEQTRDFIFVSDVVAANVHAATTDISGAYNVAGGHGLTVNGLAARIIEMVRSTSVIRHVPDRPGEIRHSQADITRLLNSGWRPQTDVDEGLRQTVAFFRPSATV